jgi:ferric-chelate reductase
VNPVSVIGRLFGSLNLFNFTFVLFPIARNSIWTLIFGIPFERALKYHKWISVWAYVCMCVHFVFMAIYNGIRNTPAYPWSTNYTAGLSGVYGPGNYGFVFCGFVSWIFFTLQVLIVTVRRQFWNFFAYSHLILAIISIVFASIHHYHVLLHFAPSLFLYFVDYLIRKISFLIPAEILSIKPMAGGITRIEIKSLLARFAKPGQYVFIYFPQASLIGRNPFSISSKIRNDTFTLHIKGIKGKCLPTFTNSLMNVASKCEEGKTKPYFIRIEGPYGKPSIRFENYKVLLLVSGGIGATPNISMLQYLANQMKVGKLAHIEKIYFVWSTRTLDSLEWFRDVFDEVKNDPKIELNLNISNISLIKDEEKQSDLPIIKGRPQYGELIKKIQENHPKVKYFGCVACGPMAMVSSVETLCWANSFNSVKRQWHFHKESFLL